MLRKGDFAAMKINWSPKAESIAELARISMLVSTASSSSMTIPWSGRRSGLRCPRSRFPSSGGTCELASFLERVYKDYFFTLESTEEDRKRTETYLANARRADERTAATSIEEFLAGLRTKIFFTRACDEDIPRAAQLTQKTNQFNLTTRRYTEQELRALQTAPGTEVFIASVADKYGDNGKVFVSIVRREALDTAELDTFLISCRVVGRFIEDQSSISW